MDTLLLILYFLFGVVLYKIIELFFGFLKYRNIVNKFPGRKANFFLGDLVYLSLERDKLFLQLGEYIKEFPNGFRAWGGIYAAFNFTKAADYEVILSNAKYIEKEYIYILLRSWLQTGLLTSNGDKWHKRRKLLTPAFHFNILKRFVTIFGEHSEMFLQELEQECNKEKTNIMPLMSNLTLNIICETAMGTRLEANSENQKKYHEAIHGLASLVVMRIINIHHFYDWFYFTFVPSGWKFRKYLKALQKFTDDVIKERERTFKDSDVENLEKNEDDSVYSKKRFAMLDLLISAKRNTGEIDDAGIREEVDTFMFEGHDTTASALSFTIFALATHKDVQEKVRSELDSIFQGSTRTASYQDLQNMTYLDRVIKETLRLYPSVPIISRTLTEDVPFRNGKYVMPKQSLIVFHIYHLHRDPEVFPDPDKFDPDRFLQENCKDRNPYAYVPFSAGPRNCIGKKFAVLEVKSVISSILRYYEIDPVDTKEDLVMMVDLVLRPKNGIHVKFRPRTKYPHKFYLQ